MINYRAVNPPSTETQAPVIQLASSLARTTAIFAISVVVPGPLNGYQLFMVSTGTCFDVVSANIAVWISVLLSDGRHEHHLGNLRPGQRALQWMLSLETSIATALVKLATAPFEAQYDTTTNQYFTNCFLNSPYRSSRLPSGHRWRRY
jgi:hypothetical protein